MTTSTGHCGFCKFEPATKKDVPVILSFHQETRGLRALVPRGGRDRGAVARHPVRPAAHGGSGDRLLSRTSRLGSSCSFTIFRRFSVGRGFTSRICLSRNLSAARFWRCVAGSRRQAGGGARLRPARVVGVGLERAGGEFLQKARRNADERVDGVSRDRRKLKQLAGATRKLGSGGVLYPFLIATRDSYRGISISMRIAILPGAVSRTIE